MEKQPARRASTAKKRRKSRARLGKILLVLIILALVIAIVVYACHRSDRGGDLRISEVMAQNNGALTDPDGDTPDWIELYNPGNKDVDLTGYSLSDNENDPRKFVFNGVTIKAGEYFVVWASGKGTVDAANRVVHLPFAISSVGETVYFYNSQGQLLNSVSFTDLGMNASCGPDSAGKTVIFDSPTPGAPNSAPRQSGEQPVVTSSVTVYINEYTTSDTVTLADSSGEYSGWAELYNYGEAAVSLKGFALTDDPEKDDKWLFPDVMLGSGEYVTVFLSGKETIYEQGGELHAGFKLAGDETALVLYDTAKKVVDSAPVYALTSNLSCGRPAEDQTKWKFFARATPGAANTVTGFDEINSALYPMARSLVISEVASVNRTIKAASDGKYYDYVELYNPAQEPVSLSGYRLSGNKSVSDACQLPNITLEPGGYYLVWCGADTVQYKTGTKEQFVTFGLNRFSEKVYLFDENNVVIDCFHSGRLDDTQSCGLIAGDDPKTYYFTSATPGAANPSAGCGGPAATPVFSEPSGYLEAGTMITISCPGATVHYTTDGSTPTEKSPVYSEPIPVNKTVTIRAKAWQEGRLPSEDAAGSYIVGIKHTLPVMFLSTDPKNLFDYSTGIFADGPGYTETFPHVGANYWKDWERPVHVEYVDESGQQQLEFNAGIKVFGQYSRAQDQKSVSINMRDKWGVKEVCYPFFGDSATNVYSELVLRNGGQDINYAHIRDAFTAVAVKDQMDLDIMDYQPIVVYLNGQYWGIYDLREKICEAYVSNRTGVPEEDMDMIKGNNMIMSGDYSAHKELLTYVKNHDLRNQEYYQYVADQVDVDELINYWICESFFNNTDTGNIKYYKVKSDGKWRWVLFDLDWALYPSTWQWNMIEEIVNPNGHGVGKNFDTTLMCGLMRNATFRDKFISRYVECLYTTFRTDRLLEIYDRMIAEIQPEMQMHINKWGAPATYASWEKNVATLRGIIEKKTDLVREQLITTCTNQSGYLPRYFGLSKAEMNKYLEKYQ